MPCALLSNATLNKTNRPSALKEEIPLTVFTKRNKLKISALALSDTFFRRNFCIITTLFRRKKCNFSHFFGGTFVNYWSQEKSQGELDFVVQNGSLIIPIEVKAEENLRAKSLRSFVQNNDSLHGVRLSLSDYREQDWMTNYPLYAVECIV